MRVLKFYRNVERGMVYGFYSHGCKQIVDNWDAKYIRVVGNMWFIDEQVFSYMPEFISEEGLKFKFSILFVSQKEEREMLGLLKVLKNYTHNLEGEDYDDAEVTINRDIEVELGDYSICFNACSSGVVTGDGGDYWEQPTQCNDWGDLDISDIYVDELGEELDLTTAQNRFLTDYLISCINLPS